MIAILFIVTVTVFIVVFLWLYLFNIYEVRIIVSPEYLVVNEKLKTEISVIPINSFGHKVAYRKVKATFTIEEGKEIIKNFIINSDSNKVLIESNGENGKIVILVKANYGIFPTHVEIPVLLKNPDIPK